MAFEFCPFQGRHYTIALRDYRSCRSCFAAFFRHFCRLVSRREGEKIDEKVKSNLLFTLLSPILFYFHQLPSIDFAVRFDKAQEAPVYLSHFLLHFLFAFCCSSATPQSIHCNPICACVEKPFREKARETLPLQSHIINFACCCCYCCAMKSDAKIAQQGIGEEDTLLPLSDELIRTTRSG